MFKRVKQLGSFLFAKASTLKGSMIECLGFILKKVQRYPNPWLSGSAQLSARVRVS